jgi:pimeloyl-ACP methyl ester carboxylesterase
MELLLLLLTLGCGSSGALMEVAPSEALTVCTEGPADGDPVVLIPGLSGCAYGFRKLTPLLHKQGFRTIIIEPLAVGESSRPDHTDYTMTAQADRIATVLDNLSVRQALFIGQGIGGSMVFRLAVERPDLLRGFVSVEAGAAEKAISPSFSQILILTKAVVKLGGKDLLRDRYLEKLKSSSGSTDWLDRRTAGRYFRGTGRDISAAMDAMTAMTRQAEPWAMAPRLMEIGIPVVVLLGTAPHEGALTSEEIETLKCCLPAVEFREIPGSGHFIYEEQPQAVADAVEELVLRITRGEPLSVGAAPVPGDDGAGNLIESANIR